MGDITHGPDRSVCNLRHRDLSACNGWAVANDRRSTPPKLISVVGAGGCMTRVMLGVLLAAMVILAGCTIGFGGSEPTTMTTTEMPTEI